MDPELLKTIRNKGLLLEKDVFEILNVFGNSKTAQDFLEQLERISGQKMITKNVLSKNVEYVKSFVSNLGDEKNTVEKTFVRFGISLEARHEKSELENNEVEGVPRKQDFKIFYANTGADKKLEVKDFTSHFRARFQSLQRILMSRPELQNNLVSMGKISSDRQSLSVIGIVTEKRITKNKNMIIKIEDLTGSVNALVKFDREDVFAKADELQLVDVIGVKASGSREMIFVHDIFHPDSFLIEKTRFNEDVNIAFISDTHCGSDRHLKKSLNKFIDWLNSEDEIAKKIKYIFIVGDTVDGVGIFPGQEDVLKLKSMEGQYEQLASYLKRVPKRITMFMCPGQHDATRVAEPQPIISKRYAPQLYEIENLILVTNPTMVKLTEGEKEFKVLMYHGASIHSFINEIKTLRLMKAHRCPAKAVEHMLKRRHLAPTHSAVVYIPNAEKDPLVIDEVPDVLCTGEVHRLDISSYNGVLIITGSCWQAQTPFEEKVGNIPDPAKVPVLNLKTRELKIFDFSDPSEVGENGSWVGDA
ncbi:MAG: metallophosphoesterase [Nanoarchaeota archaeon]|nr:metallophosphoesterase [Nanoarchaeota archaeon]